jgi:hypothetical protein
MLRQLVKHALALLPPPLDAKLSDAARWLGSARYRELGAATRVALRELDARGSVRAGPFAGMRYPVRSAAQGGLVPKLAGTYECELTLELERILGDNPSLIVDVGAADGYYAAGFAFRLPGARVIAYEMEKPLRGVIAAVARANGFEDRVDVRGQCTVEELARTLSAADARGELSNSVVMTDVEGFEDVLLDPSNIPELRVATIVCEVHDLRVPGVGSRLRERFDPTHEVSVIESRRRSPEDLPPGVRLSRPDVVLDEGRSSTMEWLVMRPRSGAAGR